MGMGGKQALPFSPLILHLQGADGSLRNGKNRFSPLPPDNPSIGTDPGGGGRRQFKMSNRVSVWRVSGWGRCSRALSPRRFLFPASGQSLSVLHVSSVHFFPKPQSTFLHLLHLLGFLIFFFLF